MTCKPAAGCARYDSLRRPDHGRIAGAGRDGDGCGDEGGAQKIPPELVVTGCDAPPVLQPAPHPLDEVAGAVCVSVIGDRFAARRGGGDHGFRAALSEKVSQMVGVVSAVGDQPPDRACRAHEVARHADVVGVAGREQQHAGPACVVRQPVELRGPPAARAANALGEIPPFAPAAERCARTCVLSIAALE